MMVDLFVNIIVVLIYFSFPLALYKFFARFGLDLSTVSVESFTVLMCFLFGYIGIPALYFGLDPFRAAAGVTDRTVIATLFLCSTWSIFSMCVGFLTARRLFQFRSGSENVSAMGRVELLAFSVLLFICLGALAAYLSQVERVALFTALSGEEGIAADRSAMTATFGAHYHRYNVLFSHVLLCVSMSFLANLLIRANILNFSYFIISFSAIVFVSIMAAQKAPLVQIFIAMYLTILYISHNKRYIGRSLFIFGSISSIVIVTFYLLFSGAGNLISAIAQPISRTFTGQLVPAYFYLEYFPEFHDFTLGTTAPNPGGLLGFSPYPLTREIMNWINPDLRAQGIVGSAPTMFWGEAYANFGFFGVAIVPFFVGLWVSFVAGFVRQLPKTPVTIGFSVWLCMSFSDLSATGFFRYVIDFNLVVVSSLVLGALLLARLFFKSTQHIRSIGEQMSRE